MFSGCGSLYKEFRLDLRVSYIYLSHDLIYSQGTNCKPQSLGNHGMAVLGPKLANVLLRMPTLHLVFFIYINIGRQWYDKLHRDGDLNDLSTVVGFVTAIWDTLRIRQGGLLHGGHPCNGCLGHKIYI